MLDLTRQEKAILIFLTLSFATGLGINTYKNSQKNLALKIQPYKLVAAREQSDKFVAKHAFININSSNTDELTRLPGIGEKLARRIIEYRKRRGPFGTKEELLGVAGIGAKKFEQIIDLIVLE